MICTLHGFHALWGSCGERGNMDPAAFRLRGPIFQRDSSLPCRLFSYSAWQHMTPSTELAMRRKDNWPVPAHSWVALVCQARVILRDVGRAHSRVRTLTVVLAPSPLSRLPLREYIPRLTYNPQWAPCCCQSARPPPSLRVDPAWPSLMVCMCCNFSLRPPPSPSCAMPSRCARCRVTEQPEQ